MLAAARLVLFAARDVWFVVGLPVFLRTQEGWSFWQAGAFLGGWVIFYGIVQASAPSLLRRRGHGEPTGLTATWLAFILAALTAAIAVALQSDVDPSLVVVVGLLVWGVIFALNSAVHSFLILHYAEGDRVAMNVGFYYMANAGGRLARNRPLRPALPVAGAHRLPRRERRVPPRRRHAVAAAAARGHRLHAAVGARSGLAEPAPEELFERLESRDPTTDDQIVVEDERRSGVDAVRRHLDRVGDLLDLLGAAELAEGLLGERR